MFLLDGFPYLPLENYLSYFTYLFKRHIQEHLKENFQVNHIFFTQPFLWDLESFDFDEEYVTWLQAIPITEAELQFIEKHGAEVGAQKLEALFEEHQIDVYDFMRPSVV